MGQICKTDNVCDSEARRLGNHPLPGLMASGRFATSLAFGPRTGSLWRYVPDTFRARLAIPANRPLLNPNTRRFYTPPNRGWSPSRHPPKSFLRGEKGLQLFPLSRLWWRIPLFRAFGCREQPDERPGMA